ncbi:putative scaffold protein [Staphylococcus phage CUB-EPI_14]|nr:putative scaffold protein [Staphylococcus phage CUB-EPI_14]
MERKFLKDLGVEDEAIDKIMDEHGKATNQLRDQLNKNKNDLKEVKEQRDEYQSKLKNNEFNEDKLNALQTKYDEALGKIDNYEQQLNTQSLEKDIIKRIPNAYDTDDVLTLLNRDKFEYDDDGKVTNLDEVLDAFKEAKPNLFKDEGGQPTPTTGEGKGEGKGESGGNDEGGNTGNRYGYRSGVTKGNPKGETDHDKLGKELADKFGKMI